MNIFVQSAHPERFRALIVTYECKNVALSRSGAKLKCRLDNLGLLNTLRLFTALRPVPVSLNMRIFLFAYFWIKLEYNHPNNRDNFVSLA